MNYKVIFITIIVVLLVALGLCSQKIISQKGGIPLVSGSLYTSPVLPDKMDFAGEEVPLDMPDVAERMDRELILNSYFHSNTILGVKRMYRHLPEIERLLKENNVPDDFKYLALAESLFGNVTSPAGASGFWQLMPETAKGYGIRINDEVDERFHVKKATIAATKYLHTAKAKFGSWTNVAASYNRGMAGLQNALDKQRVSSYYDLFLNDETTRYLFRILALKEVLQHHDRYGFNIPVDSRYKEQPTRIVKVTNSIPDLVAFAQAEGTNYKTLRLLNPWIRAYSLTLMPGEETFELRMPK